MVPDSSTFTVLITSAIDLSALALSVSSAQAMTRAFTEIFVALESPTIFMPPLNTASGESLLMLIASPFQSVAPVTVVSGLFT